MPQASEQVDGVAMPELYVRTYMTLLRSSGTVRVRALEAAHIRMRSSLHPLADQTAPDAGAFIYAMQRLPLCITDVSAVVIGQEGEQFRAVLGPDVEGWERVEAAARRRAWRWNERDTLTVHASSPSDLDDVVPCLVAYQIEWNKLHALLEAHRVREGAPLAGPFSAGEEVGSGSEVPPFPRREGVGEGASPAEGLGMDSPLSRRSGGGGAGCLGSPLPS